MSSGGIAVAVVVLAALAGGFYFIYDSGTLQNVASDLTTSIDESEDADPIAGEFSVVLEEENENIVKVMVGEKEEEYPTLFPNPKWNHMPIKVYMDRSTGEGLFGFDEQDLEYVRTAMQKWEDGTNGLISFEEVDSLAEGELIISWFPSLTEITGGRVVGEGGPSRAINTGGEYTLIEAGEVFLIPTENECVGVNRPTHEIGHVLGLGHAPPGYGDIMFSKEISCKQEITEVTVAVLEKLYAEESGPDFVVESMSAVKQGSLLNLNFTIRNIGIEESVHSNIKFLGDGEPIETLDVPRFSTLPAVLPGAGVTNRITNVKVPAGMTELTLIADYSGNNIELDEENNEARITFNN